MSTDDFKMIALGRYTQAKESAARLAAERAGIAREITSLLSPLTADVREPSTRDAFADRLAILAHRFEQAEKSLAEQLAQANTHAPAAGRTLL